MSSLILNRGYYASKHKNDLWITDAHHPLGYVYYDYNLANSWFLYGELAGL